MLDIIVVNYHTPRDLQRFIDTLNLFPPTVPANLVVVDVEVGASGEPPTPTSNLPVQTITTPDNVGYARACNRGAGAADGDVIAFFNADVELTPGALDACYRGLLDNPSWAVLGPRQVNRNGRIRHAGIVGTLAAPVHRGWNESDRGQYLDVTPVVSVSGSAYFVKRAIWDELATCPAFREVVPEAEGAFLPTAHYYEETYLSYHAQAHGYQVVYFGAVTIIHQWHQASPIGGWADRQMFKSRNFFRQACDHHNIPHD